MLLLGILKQSSQITLPLYRKPLPVLLPAETYLKADVAKCTQPEPDKFVYAKSLQ